MKSFAFLASLSLAGPSLVLGRDMHEDYTRDVAVISLGHGAASGKVLQSCLDVLKETPPAVDYSFEFFEMRSSTTIEQELYDTFVDRDYVTSHWLMDEVGHEERTKVLNSVHVYFTMIMKIERYHSTVTETQLKDSVLVHLVRGDIQTFFQSCGPSFVSSVRRETEAAMKMTTKISSNTEYKGVIAEKRNQKERNQIENKDGLLPEEKRFFQRQFSVRLEGTGFMGANGVSPLSVIEFDDLPKMFENLFKVLHKNPKAGIVRYFTTTPWDQNLDFRTAVDYGVPLRTRCTDARFREVDCDDPAVTDIETIEIAKEVARFNVQSNAEHMVNMWTRAADDMLSARRLTLCSSHLYNFPTCDGKKYLLNRYGTAQDAVDDGITVETFIRMTQMEQVQQKNQEMADYINYYFGPCMAAFGTDYLGVTRGTLFYRHWTEVPECGHFMCSLPGTKWDRDINTCVLMDEQSRQQAALIKNYCNPIIQFPQPFSRCIVDDRLRNGMILQKGQYLCGEDFSFGFGPTGRIETRVHNMGPWPGTVFEEHSPEHEDRGDNVHETVLLLQRGQLRIVRRRPDFHGTFYCDIRENRNEEEEALFEIASDCSTATCYLTVGDHGVVTITDVSNTNLQYISTSATSSLIGQNEYFIPHKKDTWANHEAKAQLWGGHLVSVPDEEKQEELGKFARAYDGKYSTSVPFNQFFIGYSSNSSFAWSDGTSSDYVSWDDQYSSPNATLEHSAIIVRNLDFRWKFEDVPQEHYGVYERDIPMTYLGCFRDDTNSRALTYLKGSGSIEQCARNCNGYKYMGRQWYGECWCSNYDNYDRYGATNDCDCEGENVGGARNCVYQIAEEKREIPGTYLGCFADNDGTRALSYLAGYGDIYQCIELCIGYRYAGRQLAGECWCGNYGYNRYGFAQDCDCEGPNVGPLKNCVYEIEEQWYF